MFGFYISAVFHVFELQEVVTLSIKVTVCPFSKMRFNFSRQICQESLFLNHEDRRGQIIFPARD